jgi:cytochrome P450
MNKINSPGPRGFEVVKVFLQLRNEPFLVLNQLQVKYGDFISASLFGRNFVILSHPKYIQHIFKDNAKNYLKRSPDFEEARPVIGNGLILSQGLSWRKQRGLMAREFRDDAVDKYAVDIAKFTTKSVFKFKNNLNTEFDLYKEFMELALEIAGSIFLGTHVDNAKVFQDAIEFNGFLIEKRMRSIIKWPRWVPIPSHVEAKKKIKKMDDIIYDIIHNYQQDSALEKGNILSKLITANLKSNNPDEKMSSKQLRDEVVTMLLSGHETTASTLTWVFYNLGRFPQWQDEIFKEVENVLTDEVVISLEIIEKLVKTKAFIYETLRLFPTVANVDRQAIDDDEISGIFIPKDTTVNISIYLLHRHSGLWNNPLVFDPRRFLGDKLNQIHPFAFTPFGKGPRSCIGETLAMAEITTIVGLFMKSLKFKLTFTHELKMLPRIATVPDGELKVKFEARI